MSPAGKLHLAMELYDRGWLCKCQRKKIGDYDEDSMEWNFNTVHEDNCSGPDNVLKILNNEDVDTIVKEGRNELKVQPSCGKDRV